MTTLIIATRNTHKLGEIRAILGGGVLCKCLADFPRAPEVVEDAATFEGNAGKKAVSLAKWLIAETDPGIVASETFVLADDSGLEVDALGGAPGVHSARFAAQDSGATGNSSDASNCAKLLRMLEGIPMERRTARFRCVMALVSLAELGSGCAPGIFSGSCEGRIQFAPKGAGGFGYDPLFVPDGHTISFAELGEAVKNGMSHRARALERVRAAGILAG